MASTFWEETQATQQLAAGQGTPSPRIQGAHDVLRLASALICVLRRVLLQAGARATTRPAPFSSTRRNAHRDDSLLAAALHGLKAALRARRLSPGVGYAVGSDSGYCLPSVIKQESSHDWMRQGVMSRVASVPVAGPAGPCHSRSLPRWQRSPMPDQDASAGASHCDSAPGFQLPRSIQQATRDMSSCPGPAGVLAALEHGAPIRSMTHQVLVYRRHT